MQIKRCKDNHITGITMHRVIKYSIAFRYIYTVSKNARSKISWYQWDLYFISRTN